MVDGLYNSVVESDVVPLPDAPVGSAENFAGNAFVVQEKVLKEASEGAREYDFERDRRWRVVNRNAKPHYSSGAAPGYVIGMKGAAARLLAREGGWVARRASFAANDTSPVGHQGQRKRGWQQTVACWQICPPDSRSSRGISLQLGERCREHRQRRYCALPHIGLVLSPTFLFNLVTQQFDFDSSEFSGTTHIPRPEDWPV